MEALALHEANLCPDCGRPMDVCADPDLPIYVDERICMFTRAVEVNRHWDETAHAKAKRTRGIPFWRDGLTYVPRPMTEAEIEAHSSPPPLMLVPEIEP